MTTFKNNAKYAELMLTYLDVAIREDNPLSVKQVLENFVWCFKGGSLDCAASQTRLKPKTSGERYPNGFAKDIMKQWPHGPEAQSLMHLLRERQRKFQLRTRGMLARLATFQVLTSGRSNYEGGLNIYSGMQGVYRMFDHVWAWAARPKRSDDWETLEQFTRELLVATSVVSRQHLPTVEKLRKRYWGILSETRLPSLLSAVQDLKELLRMVGSPEVRNLARSSGLTMREEWTEDQLLGDQSIRFLEDNLEATGYLVTNLGPLRVRVCQELVFCGSDRERYALSKSDLERLHQMTMSAASAIVGVAAQASVGTPNQKNVARKAVGVMDANIGRIVRSSRLVKVGDEVLVCKGYRRAYTAYLGVLAGPQCVEETAMLRAEATETAPEGVLDIDGFMFDLMGLDAASALNAAKAFKICPAPDVCPGYAMMDRISQIGDSNVMEPSVMADFAKELKTQMLRAYIRTSGVRLELRNKSIKPSWHKDYLKGNYEKVPSSEIDEYLVWEGTMEMPDVSKYDPNHWKDSSLGADTIREALEKPNLGTKGNMITRLLTDNECPMPGREVVSDEHVVKFFVKAEGHKDPARGIFAANLTDRQAQSWMEKAVEKVARNHPSFMIGTELDEREARVSQLVAAPADEGWVSMYYSFDISGWSAKMPAEPQRISHNMWARLFGGHLFKRAQSLNENAFIYLNLDGYRGWYRNTHSNLEGFNGKEMTMLLVTLLSLSVRYWKKEAMDGGLLAKEEADYTSALLFAYIDDGLSRLDLPRPRAKELFDLYKKTVIRTFSRCGFTVEVSKCFPSDSFAIFLNEVYIAGRHVVHGVRAAMAISSEPTERHTTLVERTGSVATGVRGAVMAGLSPCAGVMLMAYHLWLHLKEWVRERDPVILALWCVAPRAWGGLGIPNMLQMYVSGSGSAFEEGVATVQCYAKQNQAVKRFFLRMMRTPLQEREAVGVLTAPLSGRVEEGYMVDNRVAIMVRRALTEMMEGGRISEYAERLLRYSDMEKYRNFAQDIIGLSPGEVVQEQMLNNLAESHPHSIFAAFAKRMEKSSTLMTILGWDKFRILMQSNREEAMRSVEMVRYRSRC